MDELEQLLPAVLGFSREQSPPLIGDDAGVTELPDMFDRRQPAHHVVLGELVEHVEVEVAVAFMPAPRFIILARGEAERLRRLEVEDVEMIHAVLDLDEKPTVLVPNPQHTSINLHL